ncbi:MAG: cysteine hydrolase [Chloroflexi bacterium]|nr:cysteine hydrolase [Chloroflexota bacterium]
MTRTLELTARSYRIAPPPAGEVEEPLRVDVDRCALLVVDVYGAHWAEQPPSEDGLPAIYRSWPDADHARDVMRGHIQPVLAAARRAGLHVVYLTNALRSGLSAGNEWRTMSIRTCGVDVLEAWVPPNDILAFAPEFAPQPGEPLIEKQVYSGFFETHLESALRGIGARDLFLVGGDGQVCLGTTAIDAMYRDHRVIGIRDAILTGEYPETRERRLRHWFAMRQLEATVGYTTTTDAFLAACAAITPA